MVDHKLYKGAEIGKVWGRPYFRFNFTGLFIDFVRNYGDKKSADSTVNALNSIIQVVTLYLLIR